MTDVMKAVVLERFGGIDAFALREVSVPQVGPRQVRVRVHATAINPLDYQIRRGDYADQVPLPAITGHDVSGVIEEVGSHVTELRAGDAVYYTPAIFGGPGSYAEQHVADVALVGRKPENISHLEAASLTLVGGTVWEALVVRARLTVGETILIHGGTGGIGTIAIQVAKVMGARVITTARSRDHEFVRSLGADEAIDYTSTDYVEAVAELTRGKGVEVVFDTIGGDTLTRSPLTLADSGRVVSIVDIAQPQNLIDAWRMNAVYHFVFTRQNRGKLEAITTLVERGLLKPVIGATLPLARIGEAHALLENRQSFVLHGKVAIDVAGETSALPPRASAQKLQANRSTGRSGDTPE